MKRIILASIVLVASQNIMAWGLSDVTDATEKANDTVKKVDDGVKVAEDVNAKKENLEKKGLTESAKTVATEGGKGALDGAVSGALTGSVVNSGTKGGVAGVKKGWGSL